MGFCDTMICYLYKYIANLSLLHKENLKSWMIKKQQWTNKWIKHHYNFIKVILINNYQTIIIYVNNKLINIKYIKHFFNLVLKRVMNVNYYKVIL